MESIIIFRIVLIVGLVLVLIIGPINMKRRKRKQQELGSQYDDYGTYVSPLSSEDDSLSEEEKTASEYIKSNSSYPRESLKAALIQTGYSDEDVERWLDKYL